MSFIVEERSHLAADASVVWAHAVTMEGINAELAPWVRMTLPPASLGRSIDDAPLGREAFASTLLAFGVLPFDVHHLTLVERSERAFVEESWSWLERCWRHERSVRAIGDGCEILDRVTVTPRLPISVLARPIVGAMFRSRHRALRLRFGTR